MELVTGPFHPSLEQEFAATFARLRREDPLAPLAVVASSQRLADHVKEVALAALPDGFAAVRFFNLFSFARALYEEAALADWTLTLDDLVPVHLLRSLLEKHFKEERYLSRASQAPGAVLRALHELKEAAVDPDRALEMLAFEDLGLEDAPKLAEILSLYKRYSEELHRRKIHVRADVARIAAEHAPASEWLGSLKHVLYYGFYELDQNQIDLFREVQRRVPVTVFFPYEPADDYVYAKDFLEGIVKPLARSVQECPMDVRTPRFSKIATSGAHDEVWAAAKAVLDLSDRGVPYSEIGVVARSLDPYIELIQTLFRENHIPFTSSTKRKLDHDPHLKAARLLFSLEDFDRADVMDLLRSPCFRLEEGDPELWDQASRLMGIGSGAGEWRRRLGACAGKEYVHVAGERAAAKRFTLPKREVDLFWDAVRALIEAPPPPKTGSPSGAKAFAEWALERHRLFLKPDQRVERAIESLAGLGETAGADLEATLLNVLSRLSEPAGGSAGVQVLDAMAARGLSFRALIVLGMNERVFPRFILEEPFFRDAVRSRIEHRLGCRLPRKLRGYDEERLLFRLLCRSSDDITFCTQRSDDKGRLQIPSIFLSAGEERSIPRRPAERLAKTPFGLLTPREASLRTGRGEELGRTLGWDVTTLMNGLAFLREVESRGALTPYDGLIDARAYWTAVATKGLSPTALERLAECPFRYFASKVLDLEELEEPETEEQLTPIEVGEIYHDVLEGFHRSGDFERGLAASFRRFEEKRSIRYPVLWETEKEKIAEVLRAFVKRDDLSVFKPRDYEMRLEAGLPLEAGGRKGVNFFGFVDRLDVGPDGAFRVIDYKKSGGKYTWIMKTGVFEKVRYLQPPLYLLMAAKLLGQPDLTKGSFSYYFLEEAARGEKWEKKLEGSELLENREKWEGRLAELLESIPRGSFPIHPDDHCKSCDYRTMCRKGHLPTRIRADEARRS